MKHLLSGSSLLTLSFVTLASLTAQAQEAENDPIHDHGHEIDVVVVTASPHQKSRMDLLQGSNVLSGDELNKNMTTTIGETLSGLPGISSTFFGPE